MFDIIRKFSLILEKKEKRKVWFIFLISIIGAFFEMLSVSLIVPLVSSIMDENIINNNSLINKICLGLKINNHKDFIILCVICLLVVYIIKALFIVCKNTYTRKYIYECRFRVCQKAFSSFLLKPYDYYLNAKTGEIMRAVRNDVYNSFSLLGMLLSLGCELIVSLCIILVIIFINPLMSLLVSLILVIILLIVVKVIKPIMKEEGLRYHNSVSKTYKWLLQSIEGIKEIKAGGKESFFSKNFEKVSAEQSESEKRYAILIGLPRIVIELGCVSSALIALLVMVVLGKQPQALIPAFSAYALSAVRLMPAFSSITQSLSSISYHETSLDRLLENIDNIKEEKENDVVEKEISLNKKLELKDITFRYNSSLEPILEKASLSIPAFSFVGITGVSGAGKTTLVDVILGLLKPEEGTILSDGVNINENHKQWLKQVAYIPQDIFLLDGTIKENIVFGSEVVDDDKVWKVLEEAKLANFVKQQKDLLDSEIGERGIRLSGGQRQRIGIARALYSDSKLLIFDEATASLDKKTESSIMDEILSLRDKKTVIVISHHPETIKNCDLVYSVCDKKLVLENKK